MKYSNNKIILKIQLYWLQVIWYPIYDKFFRKNKGQYEFDNFFNLSYSSWLVYPRVLLDEMPDAWKYKFFKLCEELNDKFDSKKLKEFGYPDTLFIMEGVEVEGKYSRKLRETIPPKHYDYECRDKYYIFKEPPYWCINYKYPDRAVINSIKKK